MKLNFIAALYNEEDEIVDLINHVKDHVDGLYFADDGSTDLTVPLILNHPDIDKISVTQMAHTGLPETVKDEALKHVPTDSWVLMLDADERLTDGTFELIEDWLASEGEQFDYVYFDQIEVIDGKPVRNFQKCKLFRANCVQFPLNNIHADDQFTGRGTHKYWTVIHRKSTYKQIKREEEYLETYKKLLDSGLIDEGRYRWLVGLHHFIRPDNLTLAENKEYNGGNG